VAQGGLTRMSCGKMPPNSTGAFYFRVIKINVTVSYQLELDEAPRSTLFIRHCHRSLTPSPIPDDAGTYFEARLVVRLYEERGATEGSMRFGQFK
jgi:hypothetical protein